MDKIRETIGRYLPFAWWVLLSILTACACACCITLATAKIGVFWAVCGIIGTAISVIIFMFQAWGEWIERNNY